MPDQCSIPQMPTPNYRQPHKVNKFCRFHHKAPRCRLSRQWLKFRFHSRFPSRFTQMPQWEHQDLGFHPLHLRRSSRFPSSRFFYRPIRFPSRSSRFLSSRLYRPLRFPSSTSSRFPRSTSSRFFI